MGSNKHAISGAISNMYEYTGGIISDPANEVRYPNLGVVLTSCASLVRLTIIHL